MRYYDKFVVRPSFHCIDPKNDPQWALKTYRGLKSAKIGQKIAKKLNQWGRKCLYWPKKYLKESTFAQEASKSDQRSLFRSFYNF